MKHKRTYHLCPLCGLDIYSGCTCLSDWVDQQYPAGMAGSDPYPGKYPAHPITSDEVKRAERATKKKG